ncbi:MAG: heme exporter protein CcmB [Bacteroidetes bacterium]|jgi:heme exporter protein B|nr:heme exporter protein CcmB [Bacteroidota bacterium]
MSTARRLIAVISKDLRSELRTRYGITALILFVVTAIVLVVFAAADEPMPRPIAAAVLWVVMFYTAMTGLGRGFISEEERGTSLLLRLSTDPTSVYFGKLIVNIVQSVLSNLLAALLFLFFMSRVSVGNPTLLLLCVLAGSVGLASTLTIVSAIVAKAGSKSALLPILSFPVLLPLIMPGTDVMLSAFAGLAVGEVAGSLGLMASYTGIVIVVSWFVFEYIWCE